MVVNAGIAYYKKKEPRWWQEPKNIRLMRLNAHLSDL